MLRAAISLCMTVVLSATAAFADPLAGKWTLNRERSHYGGGAEARAQETFTCQPNGELLKCTIKSVRADGQKFVGTFVAAYDGKPRVVVGMPEVDEVALQKFDDLVADAAFSYKGQPVFGYRAIQSDNGQSLTIVSVDPTTRIVRSSLIVYDRR